MPESLARYVRKVVFLSASKDVPGKKNNQVSLEKRAYLTRKKDWNEFNYEYNVQDLLSILKSNLYGIDRLYTFL